MKYLFLTLLFGCSSYNNNRIDLPAGQDYLIKPYGKIHRSCLNNFGEKLLGILDKSVSEGMACLDKLKGSAAKKNKALLEKLFSRGQLTFICSEAEYDWNRAIAHASYDNFHNKPELGAVHPYISISPSMVLKDSAFKGKPENPDFVKEVIFHEYFHNIGYIHFRDQEYAYSCESCCFKKDGAESLACKICESEYTSISTVEYLSDFYGWSRISAFKKMLYYNTVARSAVFRKKGKHSLLHFLSYKGAEKDPVLTSVFAEALRRGYKLEQNDIKVASSKPSIPSDLKELALSAAKAAQTLYLDRNHKSARNRYLALKVTPLKEYLKSKDQSALILWDSILLDLNFLRLYLEEKKENAKPIVQKFKAIYDLAPR